MNRMHIELTFGRTKQRETSVGSAGSPEVRPKRAEPEKKETNNKRQHGVRSSSVLAADRDLRQAF